MPKKKRPIGRPPRKPGRDYRIKDIPPGDFRRLQQRCRAVGITMRAALLGMIRNSGLEPKNEPRTPVDGVG